MRKRTILVMLVMALLPLLSFAQQDLFQHISIKLNNGDSIQCSLGQYVDVFRPIIKNDTVVWSFEGIYYDHTNSNTKDGDPVWAELFSFNNVQSIDFRSAQYDSIEVRKALIDFYYAMDGDNWTYNDNWCSDKPISEWYGVNTYGLPWVDNLLLQENNLSGQIPESVTRMGPFTWLSLHGNNIEGSIPTFLSQNYILRHLSLGGNNLAGSFPEHLLKLPFLMNLSLYNDNLEGPLPDGADMDRLMNRAHGTSLNFRGNNFTGKVPEVIQNNKLFADAWPFIIMNNPGLDLTDITVPAPVFTADDINGNTVNLEEVYKQHQYTLLYKWGWWCPYSEEFNRQLIPVYNAYKNKGFNIEIIGIHDGSNEQLPDYLNEHPVPWEHNIVYDSWEPASRGLFINCVFPSLFLVDQNGKVVFTSIADENYQEPQDDRKWKLIPFLDEHLGKISDVFYTSTDYSHDGEVVTLQTSTIGLGIDLIFVGEGFTDKDLEDGGAFDVQMNNALEQFFAFEPYTSLRERFNVYAVKAVSPNGEFISGCVHAINGNNAKAFEYAAKVNDLIPNRPMNVIVIYKDDSKGRSHCEMYTGDNSFIAYAMDGVSNVLNHEAGGHGIGKLFDEYVEPGNEDLALPEELKEEMESQWTTLGWGANVDWRYDETEVKWSKFINDPRYADEYLGVYMGGYLYRYGVYRPTLSSMMRYNDTPFNAPSREAIYKRVMKESEGNSWTYDYETFVQFDAAGRSQYMNWFTNMQNAPARSQSIDGNNSQEQQPVYLRTAPPVLLKGTWRDALNLNK